MSSQGGRQASSKDGGGNASGRAAARRLGLLVFGAIFVVLFAVVAISEGVGDPSIPSDAVAVVEDAPEGTGEITQADFDHALEQSAAAAQVKKVPKPGDPQYEELRETAMNALFESIWLQGLAEELDITVTDAELAAERKKLEEENFQSEKEFKEFLKEAKYTEADVDERVMLQKLSADIQAKLSEEVPAVSREEVETYYEAAKSSQFSKPATRDVRFIINKDEQQAEQARRELDEDNTEASWKKVAKEFSADPATKAKGGLQKGIQKGTLEEPADAAVFTAPEGQVEGPIDTPRGFTVFEVTIETPEEVQELKAVESQIKGTLKQRGEQEYFNAFVGKFNQEWSARTFCAEGYVTARCANFKGNGHPTSAPPACYEADPDGGRPEACPAPVFQLVPAQPGSVTPLEPQGKPLAQRPRPVEGAEEAAGAATGLPEGVPPPAEAPSE